jgi:hypothetical protein
VKSLKETLATKGEAAARAARERAERETATTARMAEAFDAAAAAAGYEAALPDMTLAHSLYGSVGSLHWKDMAFDDALAIMRAFPAVPAGIYRDGSTVSFRPTSSLQFPLKEGHKYQEMTEAYAMRLSGGLGYGQKTEIDWTADLDGVLVRFAIDLKGGYEVMPRISFATENYQHEAVSIRRETEKAHFPLGGSIPLAARYGAGSKTALRSCLYVGPEVVRYVERAVDHLNAKERETRAAYERAKAASPVELPSRTEIDALAETLAEVYGREKLRAGTLRQYAALKTPAAEADRAMAEKHWPRYAEENGIGREGHGFDYYTWACRWLERVDLLTDEHAGEPYRYGSKWLDREAVEQPEPRI